jgi:hypothetical protein
VRALQEYDGGVATLDLSENCLGDDGAVAVLPLALGPTECALQVCFSDPWIGLRGAGRISHRLEDGMSSENVNPSSRRAAIDCEDRVMILSCVCEPVVLTRSTPTCAHAHARTCLCARAHAAEPGSS